MQRLVEPALRELMKWGKSWESRMTYHPQPFRRTVNDIME